MPDLSEFAEFVSKVTKIKKQELIKEDIILHKLLFELTRNSYFSENFLFKGGSCLTKCYFGYYRFSVDLDFTYKNQSIFEGLLRKEKRKILIESTEKLSHLLEEISTKMNLTFEVDLSNRKFVEFGSKGRMITFKLWRGNEFTKIQVNFVELLLFPEKERMVKTLLDKVRIGKDVKIYFNEFLNFYRNFKIGCYDEREILSEKVRAILTRKTQKLRDFYDLFVLDKKGIKIENQIEEIKRKIRFSFSL